MDTIPKVSVISIARANAKSKLNIDTIPKNSSIRITIAKKWSN